MNEIEVKESFFNTKKRELQVIEYPDDLEEFNKFMGNSKSDMIHDLGLIK